MAQSSTLVVLAPDVLAMAAGTFFYKDLTGNLALEQFLNDQIAGCILWERVWGSFALLTVFGKTIALTTDQLGTLHLYCDQDETLFSTSFLALAETVPQTSINASAVYDYVFTGASLGLVSVLNEICLFAVGNILEISDVKESRPWPKKLTSIENESERDWAGNCLLPLREHFKVIESTFHNEVDTALSGGYDSRLILALLWAEGTQPYVHVYGKLDDDDVTIAKHIAVCENFELTHVDKSKFVLPSLENFAEMVRKTYLGFDGYPPDGIFTNGADLVTRSARCKDGRISLNGGGGEMFRDFFRFADRPFSSFDVVLSIYAQFDETVCTKQFNRISYLEGVANRICQALGVHSDVLTRREVESVLPLFDCRFWMARNNSINNRFGLALTPFVDASVVERALETPIKHKRNGRLQSQMIHQASASLASHASAYGFGFDQSPPLASRFAEILRRLRPPQLRQYSYRFRHQGRDTFPEYLTGEYLNSVLDGDMRFMSSFFDINAVKDVRHFNRICTLEYMFRLIKPRGA